MYHNIRAKILVSIFKIFFNIINSISLADMFAILKTKLKKNQKSHKRIYKILM
jgi:hypothetical protein